MRMSLADLTEESGSHSHCLLDARGAESVLGSLPNSGLQHQGWDLVDKSRDFGHCDARLLHPVKGIRRFYVLYISNDSMGKEQENESVLSLRFPVLRQGSEDDEIPVTLVLVSKPRHVSLTHH